MEFIAGVVIILQIYIVFTSELFQQGFEYGKSADREDGLLLMWFKIFIFWAQTLYPVYMLIFGLCLVFKGE